MSHEMRVLSIVLSLCAVVAVDPCFAGLLIDTGFEVEEGWELHGQTEGLWSDTLDNGQTWIGTGIKQDGPGTLTAWIREGGGDFSYPSPHGGTRYAVIEYDHISLGPTALRTDRVRNPGTVTFFLSKSSRFTGKVKLQYSYDGVEWVDTGWEANGWGSASDGNTDMPLKLEWYRHEVVLQVPGEVYLRWIAFEGGQPGEASFQLDDVQLTEWLEAPTPTDSPTDSPTLTPTCTITDTPTITPTLTTTNSPTAAATFSNTSTPTGTPTSSPTRTPSQSPTDTPTLTPTWTASVTPTDTPQNTASHTPTDSPTWTVTATASFTWTPTETASSSPTETDTPTWTPRDTETATWTPTNSPRPTSTPTATPTSVDPDYDKDTLVDSWDLLVLIRARQSQDRDYDLTGDNAITAEDFFVLSKGWRPE